MVRDVKDYQGAEIFCLNSGVFRGPRRGSKAPVADGSLSKEPAVDIDKKKTLFMVLLQEYLNMAQDQGGMALTLYLLDSQSSYLDLSEVIDLLPSFWSVELLQQYLLRSLRRSYHEFKEMQIVKGLSLGENLRICEELFQLYETQGPVVITADDICHVCGIAVADSVFMRTVDMKTIHLHCGSSSDSQPLGTTDGPE
ncbi:vacuolar sorting protein 39 domain 2-domain-containing protein [Gamsiella multidivaricata]|uniref:vacuolar sorting protein 39 domain 2-domain-containing protein n=1 Tax=Gamsiella multidivaricata TaxID=101098 RepID=UPI00222125DD|nr:vacuolar sorting protein 39 domain 2-domain-containing protein [Gamsiella multidivaricata]KAI7826543.1 vacuolar sorting protein 39 domain 2-domain-containing protein [Gamsiella multidivaricata]